MGMTVLRRYIQEQTNKYPARAKDMRNDIQRTPDLNRKEENVQGYSPCFRLHKNIILNTCLIRPSPVRDRISKSIEMRSWIVSRWSVFQYEGCGRRRIPGGFHNICATSMEPWPMPWMRVFLVRLETFPAKQPCCRTCETSLSPSKCVG